VKKRLLAIAAALLLVAAPIAAQQDIPEGTVGVFVYQIVDGEAVLVGEPIVVVPPVCLPDDVT